MKLGFADYPHLVDVKRIAELRRLDASADVLEVGAAMTHRRSSGRPSCASAGRRSRRWSVSVGNLRVRVMGTIGGNLCFADPHSDPATFLLATGGSLVCRRGDGPARELSIADFVKGPYQTALRDRASSLTSVRVPQPGPGAGIAHEKMSLHERPAVTVTCLARVHDGVSGLGAGGRRLGGQPARRGRSTPRPRWWARLPTRSIRSRVRRRGGGRGRAEPVEDGNGSVEYKRQLVRVLVTRCARTAVERARSA